MPGTLLVSSDTPTNKQRPCPLEYYSEERESASHSVVQLCVTAWTVACQAPLTVEFSRQEYWSGLPCPPKGDLPDPWIESVTLMSSALAGGFFTTSATWEAQILLYVHITQAFSRIITFHLSLHSTTLTMKIILKIGHDFIFSQKFEGIFYGS